MKKTAAQFRQEARERYMLACQTLILAQRPELTGKFSNLRIYDTLQYFYTCCGITPEIAASRILGSAEYADPNHIK